ncbi:ZirU family protein [Pseudomonas sp. 5P_3.1_Bac2]|uniref:ZirU family protein n=1 Tax=Pseudomonas sp. 5P_3.1_Bac2 TaxID=2971617 RepID=UPI0021CAB8B6|nr:ZirU family protein [Pseudomonas sp. 5P_3.1_Bac2]MCU1719457.1 ZirU family protein [Pseudomonas sp. 5P_3.1_Bac2]
MALFFYGYEVTVAPLAMASAALDSSSERTALDSQRQFILHVAQSESLAQVAQRFAVSEAQLRTLQEQNQARGWSQSLWLVPKSSSGETASYPGYVLHQMRAGESLASLALANNRSVAELRRLNAMVMGDSAVAGLSTGGWLLLPAPVASVDQTAQQGNQRQYQAYEQRVAQLMAAIGETHQNRADSDVAGQSVSGMLGQQLASGAGNALANEVEELLGNHGRARVNVSTNLDSKDVNLELDYLHPLLQHDKGIAFAQVGTRRVAERHIGNLGVGYRHQVSDKLMLGVNTFIDQDFTRDHTRASMGVEAWGESARLGANLYAPVSGWKASDEDSLNKDPELYDLFERPAKGWDARAEIALPGAPQLALTGKYFQWQGESVDVSGSGSLEKNPKGYSAGIKWQPVPLLGFAAEHQKIQGGDSSWQVGASLNWSFDLSLDEQLDSKKGRAVLPLAQARTDFVQRDYSVVLEYKHKDKKFEPFVFAQAQLELTAPLPSATGPLVSPGPELRGVIPSAQIRYEKGAETLDTTTRGAKDGEVSVDPATGYVSVPPGLSGRTVQVIAYREISGTLNATASYQLVVKTPLDSDGDGLFDLEEEQYGTDPHNPDSDGDGMTDKEEVDAGFNPLDPSDPGPAPEVDVTDIQGTLEVGQSLTGVYSFDDKGGDATDASTVRWLNGATVDSDTTYELSAEDVGRVLTFEVEAKNAKGVVGNTDRISTAEAPGVSGGDNGSIGKKTPKVSNLSISGLLEPGQTLTGSYDFIDNDDDSSNDAANDASVVAWLNGAQADSDTQYLLHADDVGKVLTFEVTAKRKSDGLNGNVERVDTATAIAPPSVDPQAPLAVAVSGLQQGHPIVGQAVTAEVSCSGTCAAELLYDWQIETAEGSESYTSIGQPSNSNTYLPLGTEQKRRIRVEVTKP